MGQGFLCAFFRHPILYAAVLPLAVHKYLPVWVAKLLGIHMQIEPAIQKAISKYRMLLAGAIYNQPTLSPQPEPEDSIRRRIMCSLETTA